MSAWAIAALAYNGALEGAKAGATAAIASRRTRRTVERDDQGRITGVVEEPAVEMLL